MASPPKLTGETLIVHHIPLVHCQVPAVRAQGIMGKRAAPFSLTSDLGSQGSVSLSGSRTNSSSNSSSNNSNSSSNNSTNNGDSGRVRGREKAGLSSPCSTVVASLPDGTAHVQDQDSPRLSGPCGAVVQNDPRHTQQSSFHLHNNKNRCMTRWRSLSSQLEGGCGVTIAADGQGFGISGGGGTRRDPAGRGSRSARTHDNDDGGCDGDYGGDDVDCERNGYASLGDANYEYCENDGPHGGGCGGCGEYECSMCSTRISNGSARTELSDFGGDAPGGRRDVDKGSDGDVGQAPTGSSSSMQWSPLESESFYLDLHSSPCGSQRTGGGGGSSSSSPSEPFTVGSRGEARLVQAMQNYYRLVTVDLSTQSTPSHTAVCSSAESSASSEGPGGAAFGPAEASTEYYLFDRPHAGGEGATLQQSEEEASGWRAGAEASGKVAEREVAASDENPHITPSLRQRSKSYDQSLGRKPLQGIVSFNRLLSCPSELSQGPASQQATPQKRVTSFAKIAQSRKKGGGPSPPPPPPQCRHGDLASMQITPIDERSSLGNGPYDSVGSACRATDEAAGGALDGSPGVGRSLSRRSNPFQSEPNLPQSSGGGKVPSSASFTLNGRAVPEYLQTWSPSPPYACPADNTMGGDGARSGGAEDGLGTNPCAKTTTPTQYGKEHRPTTLPIQPFILHHHLSRQLAARPISRPTLTGTRLAALGSSQSLGGSQSSRDVALQQSLGDDGGDGAARSAQQAADARDSGSDSDQWNSDGGAAPAALSVGTARQSLVCECRSRRRWRPPPGAIRPSPLGSLSPIRADLLLLASASPTRAAAAGAPLPSQPPPPPRSSSYPPTIATYSCGLALAGDSSAEQSPAGSSVPGRYSSSKPGGFLGDSVAAPAAFGASPKAGGSGGGVFGGGETWRPQPLKRSPRFTSLQANSGALGPPQGHSQRAAAAATARHLAETRWGGSEAPRPLRDGPAAERVGDGGRFHSSCANSRASQGTLIQPGTTNLLLCSSLERPSARPLQAYYSDFCPDYFSMAERPPHEFCLSPDDSDSSTSIDLLEKRALVQTVNSAIDLIVAHFGTTRDAGVKAKLGDSSVSPNVGHLVLKYLCPALSNVLKDGLRPHLLDLIVGRRRNTPWSVVESSTQLGPSTKRLHGLYQHLCQLTELSSQSMRFNAFILGLLNMKSLDFWINYLHNHEGILTTHYLPEGFLAMPNGACAPLVDELVLLLQPLALLPFRLDERFEVASGEQQHEQIRQHERLRSQFENLQRSVHSTFQFMRNWSNATAAGAADATDAAAVAAAVPGEGVVGRTMNELAADTGVRGSDVSPDGGDDRVAAVGLSDRSEKDPEGFNPEQEQSLYSSCQEPRDDVVEDWWQQLKESSQIYLTAEREGGGPRFSRWNRPHSFTYVKAGEPPEKQISKSAEPHKGHSPDGRNFAQGGKEKLPTPDAFRVSREPTRKSGGQDYLKKTPPSDTVAGQKKRGWLRSPPDSDDLDKPPEGGQAVERRGGDVEAPPPPPAVLWLGRLFGASPHRQQQQKNAKDVQTLRSPQINRQANGLPSSWLGLDMSAFGLVTSLPVATETNQATPSPDNGGSVPAGATAGAQSLAAHEASPRERGSTESREDRVREVTALCHHAAADGGQPSVRRGDVPRATGAAVPGRLLCRAQGGQEGPAPAPGAAGFVSPVEDSEH
ncbi:unnamed protein product [Lampetra planeri]